MYCRNCGKGMDDKAAVCVGCGVPVKVGTAFCQNCGSQTNAMAEVCTSCGVRLASATGVGDKSKLAAGLLGILLGSLGVHRFYLGYTGIGIIQIVVTFVTFGVGAIWGFIEGIMILTGSFNKDAQGNSLTD